MRVDLDHIRRDKTRVVAYRRSQATVRVSMMFRPATQVIFEDKYHTGRIQSTAVEEELYCTSILLR